MGEASLSLPPGDYQLYVQPANFWRETADGKTVYAEHRSELTIPAQSVGGPLVVRLEPCCTMHAEVVDADTGRPIANARLTITIARPLPGGRGSLIEEVWQHRGGPVDSTDAQGRAAVAMPPGKRAAVGMSAGQFPFKLEVAGYGPFTSSESLEMPAGKEVKLRVELQKSQ